MKSKEQKENDKSKQSSKIPEEIKISKRCKLDLIICLIHTLLIEIYFIVTHIIKDIVQMQSIEIYLKSSYMIFIALAIVLFEIAYKKASKHFAVHGIEVTLLATHLLLIEKNINIVNILETSYIWILYHCLKALIIYTKENRRRLKQISDISQIVKEEKPTKKVAKKRKS